MSVAFAQQGTVDWTSLGRMQFSASIAVLSRLSSAGIESLTVAFGQAICTRVPLGAHGEKFLMESLNKLKPFSSFGDLVWFGVGVRHVLRDLVRTAEGASLVALCASLSQTYNPHVAALILYEMAKELKAPSELSPSLTQWDALIKTASCVFTQTTFSLRTEKLLRLAGFSDWSLPLDVAFSRTGPGHPQDIARCIIALGDVMRGEVEQITVEGGRASCWLATYASLVLSLRVELALDGSTLFSNYNERNERPQLRIDVGSGIPMDKGITHVGTTFTVRNGKDFIEQVFGESHDGTIDMEGTFYAGTVQWETLIVDSFGEDGRMFLDTLNRSTQTVASGHGHETNDEFKLLFEASICLLMGKLGDARDYQRPSDYTAVVADKLPELRGFQGTALSNRVIDVDHAARAFQTASNALQDRCQCSRCTKKGIDNSSTTCLVIAAYTIVLIAHLMERCRLHSALHPRRFGVHSLYLDVRDRVATAEEQGHHLDSISKFEILFPKSTLELFDSYITLFTGTRSRRYLGRTSLPRQSTNVSAHSAGGIFCFIDSLAGLSMNFAHASRIHVGSGTIECRSRLHTWVFDRDNKVASPSDPDYPLEDLCRTTDLSDIWSDTSSSSMTIEAVVEDAFHLVFYYRISSPAGVRVISPATFVMHSLAHIAQNIWTSRMLVVPAPKRIKAQERIEYGLARGEGKPRGGGNGLVLRPHKGNLFAQCVVASWYPRVTGYVTTNADVDSMVGWYAMKTENLAAEDTPPSLYILSG
ncbi:hypothetical protein BJX64DRAFT_267228 [Aspergillus heterothallicus]